MLTDAVLVDRVIAGFDGAFDELYRRHASAAWRLGQAVTGNSHDAADAVSEAFARVLQAVRAGRLEDGDAFRSYLLTATRNAALDGMRRSGRSRPTDDDELALVAAEVATPADRVAGTEEATLVAEAFRNLPERWRSVLWLTEVEGIPTKEAADQLGLSANGTAQLAVRARAGLRERFLQAHLRTEAEPACRFTVDRLGAYVGGGLSPRDLAKVDQHLAGCATCLARKEELEDVGSTLRRIALPIPLALGALSADRVRVALTAVSTPTGVPGLAARAAALAQDPTPTMRKLVAASAAGVFGLGLLSLGVVGGSDPAIADLVAPPRNAAASERPALPEATLATSTASLLPLSSSSATPSDDRHLSRRAPLGPGTRTLGGPAGGDAPGADPQGDTSQAAPPSPSPLDPPSSPSSPSSPASPDPLQILQPITGVIGGGGDSGGDSGGDTGGEPLVEVVTGGTLGDHSVGTKVSVGPEPEAALTVDEEPVVGEPVPAPEDDGVQVTLGGGVIPETTISLP
jgi:RNA polymerase sigma factor (sigma-70 family)